MLQQRQPQAGALGDRRQGQNRGGEFGACLSSSSSSSFNCLFWFFLAMFFVLFWVFVWVNMLSSLLVMIVFCLFLLGLFCKGQLAGNP